MIVWAGLLVGAVMAQGLAPTAAVPGASTSVRVEQGRLIILASAGVTNRITVEPGNQLLYVSDVVGVMPGTGCQRVTATRVSCPAGGVGSVFFLLGDGDDTADLDLLVPVDGSGEGGNDGIWGGSGADKVSGGAGDDSIYGNGGADYLYGGDDADILYGGSGPDHLYGDSTSGEPGCLLGPLTCYDHLYGQSGADYLDGGELMDHLYGGDDADVLYEPTSGSNHLDGGLGDDTITGAGPAMRDMAVYGDRPGDVAVNLSAVPYDGESGTVPANSGGELALLEHDMITGVNDIQTGAGDDTLIGAGATPVLLSGAGTDLCDSDGGDGVVLMPCP